MNRVGHQLQAMQLDDQAQEEQGAAVLRILLQHDSARRELRVVSRLLCCSKEVAAAVAEHCAGQLDFNNIAFHPAVRPSIQRPASSWLRKHATLAQALNLLINEEWLEHLMAAGPQNLRLQSLSAITIPVLPLLEQLPASFLTHMQLTVTRPLADEPGAARYAARVSAALGRLTALRSLELFNSEFDLCLPGLSSLSNLTSLLYRGQLCVPQHMPGQLLELKLQLWSRKHDPSGPGTPSARDVRHLTALTSLAGADLVEGDVLPPNLLRLEGHSRSVQPLLPLQKLQHLRMHLLDADFTTPQLLGMSRLTSLDITYVDCSGVRTASSDAVAPAGVSTWPLLPLKQLRLRCLYSLAPAFCQALPQTTGLTSLCLHGCGVPGGPLQLAADLKSLSGLQELQLQRLFFPEQSEDVSQLVQAIASLKQLRRLHVEGVAQFASSACSDMLASLSSVTELKLVECDLCDGFASVFPGLPELRSLDLSGNTRLTDAGLCAVVPQVQQLTNLALCRTGATDAGLLHLTSLTQLGRLDVFGAAAVTEAGVQRLRELLPGLN